MKILFLDIDGVVNCATTTQRHRGFIGIDPYMAFLVGDLVDRLDLKVVLSSTWRKSEDGREEVRKQVCKFIDITPSINDPALYESGTSFIKRGYEIKSWLDNNPLVKCDTPTSCPYPMRAMCQGHEVEKYAILDDDSDMLEEQMPNFFKTSWQTGVTPEHIKLLESHFAS